MAQDRMGALTPQASAMLHAVVGAMGELGEEDYRLRELIARAAAPLLGQADEEDWHNPRMPLVRRATLLGQAESDHDNY